MGTILLTAITYVFTLKIFSGELQVVFIVAEPAGWFLIWIGLEYIFFTNKNKKPDMEFYDIFPELAMIKPFSGIL